MKSFLAGWILSIGAVLMVGYSSADLMWVVRTALLTTILWVPVSFLRSARFKKWMASTVADAPMVVRDASHLILGSGEIAQWHRRRGCYTAGRA